MANKMVTMITVVSKLLLQASAQLLSCYDIGCPVEGLYAKCKLEERSFTSIGVSRLTSSLSSSPLTWTVGFTPGGFNNFTAQKRYYLSTPQELNLSGTDVSGCAFFFTGIETGLRFDKPHGTYVFLGDVSGTCADALEETCVSDLTQQARLLVRNSPMQNELQCSSIAGILQASPPASCKTNGTWGSITAKAITGPDSTSALKLQGCNPTINATYAVHSIAKFSNSGVRTFVVDVTPVMTIFKATDNMVAAMSSPEVHLNCLKPMAENIPSPLGTTGSGEMLRVQKSLPAMLFAVLSFLVVVVFAV